MSADVSDRKRRRPPPGRRALAAFLVTAALTAPAWVWAVLAVPAQTGPVIALIGATTGIALCAAVAVAVHYAVAARDIQAHSDRLNAGAGMLEHEAAYLVDVLLPAVADGAREGRSARVAFAQSPQPAHPALRRLAHAVGTELDAARRGAAEELTVRSAVEDELARLGDETLPFMLSVIRADRTTAAEAMARVPQPVNARVARLRRRMFDELVAADRRADAAMEAGAGAGARLQARVTTLLAQLRELQDRYGDREDVFGDLLELDHGVAQTGRLADGFVTLSGGRSGRRWTRPIIMESILRGAMGRINAYRRVRTYSTSTVAVVGVASEAVMQALAELMDNAANFSAHGTEVHVYVQEEDTGVTVTIEDSGLGMRLRERRVAENLVSEPHSLATVSGTGLGLAVVGRLADKYGFHVSFRPSSRGGTGVVVLLPPHLITQPRRSASEIALLQSAEAFPAEPGTEPEPDLATTRIASSGTTGLPQRRRGRTLRAAAHPLDDLVSFEPEPISARASSDAAARFAAFRHASGAAPGPAPDADLGDGTP